MLRAAAQSRIIINKSLNCSKNLKIKGFFFASVNLLRPFLFNLSRASACSNPIVPEFTVKIPG